ncbi:MAG TPA: TIM44-like domain-containing protein [Polyangiaceae bacterium]|nr:TIM44-like domain-containing protein [Polyangiaceae bacterium]
MSRRDKRRFWILLLLCLALVLVAALAAARPGGGHSYSGGSRSSGSGSSSRSSGGGGGGGGDGGVLFELLIYLIIENPSIGIPLLILVGVVMVVKAVVQRGMKSWSTTPTDVSSVGTTVSHGSLPRKRMEELRQVDPEFSLVLFEDFVYMMYQAVHRARALGAQPLAAYLEPGLCGSLTDPGLADVQGIVVGALRYEDFSGLGSGTIQVELELEANYVEYYRNGQQQRFYVVDKLVLSRAHSAKSRPFSRAHKLDCPNCGAPLEAMQGTQCSYCRQDVGHGRFDWMIVQFANTSRELRGPLLTENVAESGTDTPTIADAAAPARFQELQQRDPTLNWQTFTTRIAHVYNELQVAWSSRDPLRIRPYVSDNQFQTLLYWIDMYVAQRCRNITENARILRIDLANVTSDKHYDAITVRLFATSTDYTISDDGKLLSGHKSRMRTYSEYWTWIRGTARRGQTRGDLNCPNCGAQLRIGMAGTCEYCRVKVTAGEFDWVLSRIEQDDSYTG